MSNNNNNNNVKTATPPVTIDITSNISYEHLSNITDTDQLGPALKGVFESGKEKEYVSQLQGFIKKKQSEIEEICSSNYQEFINSVDELLAVRADTTGLRESVVRFNRDMQGCASSLLSQATILAEKKERKAKSKRRDFCFT
eukprot:TRINITY_DN12184_c0_g1_i1.p2 TRINITY_DN12184_c0_g1~~TRINITY_DN12184_c0_g1_i1.p2  ORF type:complete len:142 (+),score=40.20 TRINITY_DN12184_c0_g1_i1:34-459(+)